MSCDNWTNDFMGPLNIDYLYFYQCQCQGFQILGAWLLFLWVVYLINIVSTTASNYFSPTLSSICKNLHIRYDIAGVTFLAFGNGAPDVFSSITSFSGSVDVSIGINALLGGSMFVASVVVGAIAIISPTDVTPQFFIRDILFHILSISTLGIVGILGSVSLFYGFILFVIYGLYVIIVLTSTGSHISSTASSEVILSSIQTAFWHRSASSKKKHRKFRQLAQEDPEYHISSTSSSHNSNFQASNYQFLTLSDDNSIRSNPIISSSSSTRHDDGNDHVTINLFDHMNANEFEGSIVEDYVSSHMIPSPSDPISSSSNLHHHEYVSFEIASDPISSSSSSLGSTLTSKLLPAGNDIEYHHQTSSSLHPPSLRRQASISDNILAMFYWQQQHHRLRKHLLLCCYDEDHVWHDMPLMKKIWYLIELPVNLARDLTIPTLDPTSWNKFYAVLHPISSSLFINYILGYNSSYVSTSTMPMPMLCIIIACPFSIMIHLLTHHNKPPQDVIMMNIWHITAFMMSIAWIYTLSKELIVCLSAIGEAFDISPGFLGLTVLAWGNSIGDLISNTAIARQGFGEMALAGCYGGPVFNILIGLGLSFIYACWHSYPKVFIVELHVSSIISMVFLYVALLSTLGMVYMKGYKLDPMLGKWLIGLYVLYTICQIIALSFISSDNV